MTNDSLIRKLQADKLKKFHGGFHDHYGEAIDNAIAIIREHMGETGSGNAQTFAEPKQQTVKQTGSSSPANTSEIRSSLAFGHRDIMNFIENGTPNERLLAKQYNELSDNFCGLAYELKALEEMKPVSVSLDKACYAYRKSYAENEDGEQPYFDELTDKAKDRLRRDIKAALSAVGLAHD